MGSWIRTLVVGRGFGGIRNKQTDTLDRLMGCREQWCWVGLLAVCGKEVVQCDRRGRGTQK